LKYAALPPLAVEGGLQHNFASPLTIITNKARIMSLQPTEIKLHQQSRLLEISFGENISYQLPYEFLRVYSPSAEVVGHGPGEEVLQTGKKTVSVREVVPAGSYAIQIEFDDGHDSGIYTWEYLRDLGEHQEVLWQNYLDRLAAAGASREAP
jgi:DUF971 family protein